MPQIKPIINPNKNIVIKFKEDEKRKLINILIFL